MMARNRFSVIICSTFLLFSHAAVTRSDEDSESSSTPPVVIPFDFESKFDQGRYGQMLGDMIWKKLERRGQFVIPEAMLDVRDWSERTGILLTPDTPLDTIQNILREEFGGQIAIWGKVERLPNVAWDQYDIWIKIADLSTSPPRMIADVKGQTKTASEIPHRFVQQALDQLYEPSVAPDTELELDSLEQAWKTGPNLIDGGDFESQRGWDPLPLHVTRVRNSHGGASSDQFLRFTIPEAVAASTGVLYYSDYFPVEENATYRFQCRWRTTGSAAKVFVKCYDELPTRYAQPDSAARRKERREVYRSQQNLKGSPQQWHVHAEDFTPKHTHYQPRWGRVMLYGYWPQGVIDWDDVVVKQISPPPLDQSSKVRRPSLETKVQSHQLQRQQDE